MSDAADATSQRGERPGPRSARRGGAGRGIAGRNARPAAATTAAAANPEKQTQPQSPHGHGSTRVFELAKASISREAVGQRRSSEDQDTHPQSSGDEGNCILFEFPAGAAGDGESKVMKVFSKAQSSHVLRVYQSGASDSHHAFTAVFDDKLVASRTAKGLGTLVRIDGDQVKVFGPNGVGEHAASSAVRTTTSDKRAGKSASAESSSQRRSNPPSEKKVQAAGAKKPSAGGGRKKVAETADVEPEPALPGGDTVPHASSSSKTQEQATAKPSGGRGGKKTSSKSGETKPATPASSSRASASNGSHSDKPALPEGRVSLFVGGLSPSCTEDDIRHALGRFLEQAEEICLKEGQTRPKRNSKEQPQPMKYVYVKFATRALGQKALDFWQQTNPIPSVECRLYSALPSSVPSQETKKNGKVPAVTAAASTPPVLAAHTPATVAPATATGQRGQSARVVTIKAGGSGAITSVSVAATTGVASAGTTPASRSLAADTEAQSQSSTAKQRRRPRTVPMDPGLSSKDTLSSDFSHTAQLESRKAAQNNKRPESSELSTRAPKQAAKSLAGQGSIGSKAAQEQGKGPSKQTQSASAATAALPASGMSSFTEQHPVPVAAATAAAAAAAALPPPQPAKPHSATVSVSKFCFDFVLEYFTETIKEYETRHDLMLAFMSGKAAIKCLQRSVCLEVQQWMDSAVTEKFIQLKPREYSHFSSTPADLQEAMPVMGTQCQAHLLEKTQQLLLVGLSSSVASAWRSMTEFLARTVLLSFLQVEFLQRHTLLASILSCEHGLELHGLQTGSKRLDLVPTRVPAGLNARTAVRRGKEHIETLLDKWHVERVNVDPVLAKTASRLLKRLQLPVILASVNEELSMVPSYVLAGSPSEPVIRAQQLLETGPSCSEVQLSSPPFTANYLWRLVAQDASLQIPSHLNTSCLGDVQVLSNQQGPDYDSSSCTVQIRSYVYEDVEEALQFFTLLRDSFKEEMELEPFPTSPSLCLYYLAFIIEFQDSAKKAVADIQTMYNIDIKSSTSSTPCVSLFGSKDARELARQAIFKHPALLANLNAKYISLPTLTMDMIGLLRKRFLDIVENKVGVVCLTFQATKEITRKLEIQTPPREDSVIVAVFGKVFTAVQHAQSWILSLEPTKVVVSMSEAEFDNLMEEDLEWSAVESQHVAQITTDKENHSVCISGLTKSDVENAQRAVEELKTRFAPVVEEMELTREETLYTEHKVVPELEENCKVSFTPIGSTNKRMTKISGKRHNVAAVMASIRGKVQGLRSVHIKVSFPNQLSKCLESTWSEILEVSAERESILCLSQEKSFLVSSTTPVTRLDCRPVLQLPPSFPESQIDGCMFFLVVGSDRKEFTDMLQTIRNAGSSIVSQHIVLDREQCEMVQEHFAKDGSYQEGGVFMHVTQKGVHVCATSREELSTTKKLVAKWLEKQATVPICPVVKKLVQDRISHLEPTLKEQYQSSLQWKDGQLLVSGPVPSVDGAMGLLFESLVAWEQSICTRSLSIAHWLVPALVQPAVVRLLQELEESVGVVCLPSQAAVVEYQQAVKAEIHAKVQSDQIKLMRTSPSAGTHFVTPPSALVWHMNGLDENSVMVAGQKLSELFAVPLSAAEVDIAGKLDADLCKRVAQIAAEHLVEITIQPRQTVLGPMGQPGRPLYLSCHLLVRGIPPRPASAVRALQSRVTRH